MGKRLTLDQKIQNMTDDEKIRVLYRIEIYEWNKKLSRIFSQTSNYIQKHAFATADFMRKFYETGSLVSTEEINDRLINGNVCDYFDAYTMKAYANYAYEFCKAFDKYKAQFAKKYREKKIPVDWKKASKDAYKPAEKDAIKIVFRENGVDDEKFRILDTPVTQLNAKYRQDAKEKIMNYFGMNTLYFNEEKDDYKEWEARKIEEEIYKEDLKAQREREEAEKIGIGNPDYVIYDELHEDDYDEDENENY